jgi:hypothetical protein
MKSIRTSALTLAASALTLALWVCLACCGCTQPAGLVRYTLSGAVTMPDGQPVPAGEIGFEPDSASGNKGPGSLSQIKDGKYSLPQDQGIVGGKYVVVISPFDGIPSGDSPQGKPLLKLPHSVKVDFPAQNSTHDFKISK